ncbi:glycosyl transferase family 2 [Chitinophaga dinghuensis]|uniref:Glycosyl transferase family 2 n=1 Tax=Chitinophaga dinghuensis TaxID=1539050 RepID=A0A327VQ94_9BACT|nr:glycosyltransferase [Chitinophaga dinghuensis]RAJ77455.1 glycosyl transferase family 2 [Chitinophaga dinghuensis]
MDYSVIICTYNPDVRILQRCLSAITALDTRGLEVEYILVDNNSRTPVVSLLEVQTAIRDLPRFQVLHVTQQGVKYARIAAIEKSTGNHIVYIDYDNEPATDYLQQLKLLNGAYPQVGAWGPGQVFVDFIDGVKDDIAAYARYMFQERHDSDILFDTSRQWQECYPFGTGLCTNAALLKEYVALATAGHLTLTGRTAEKLTSGEDTQMILHVIRKGFAAGVSPTLQLNHIIPGNRANDHYLRRLTYGTSICYATCLLQVFPEMKQQMLKQLISPGRFIRKTIRQFLSSHWQGSPSKRYQLVQFIGLNSGYYQALNKVIPFPVKHIAKFLQVEE